MTDTAIWIQLEVDEDGNVTARDVVEDVTSDPFATVQIDSALWPDLVATAVRQCMERAGMVV